MGSEIKPLPEGGYRVDDRMTLKFEISGAKFDVSGAAEPIIRNSRGRTELLVPVRFAAGKAEIVETILW
jgi:hypothetical protein